MNVNIVVSGIYSIDEIPLEIKSFYEWKYDNLLKGFISENIYKKSINKPFLNKGKKWKNEEEIALIEEMKNRKTVEQMSLLHGRTILEIKCRINYIIVKMYNEKILINDPESIYKISEFFNSSPDKIKNIIINWNFRIKN